MPHPHFFIAGLLLEPVTPEKPRSHGLRGGTGVETTERGYQNAPIVEYFVK